MERDCMIAHGAAFFLKERMLDVSDLYKVYINRKNGLIAIGTPENGTLREDITDAKPVYVPYAFKLLLQELMAIGIYLWQLYPSGFAAGTSKSVT